MNEGFQTHGSAAVTVMNRLEGWEANLVRNLRLWCDGPLGRSKVCNEYARAYGAPVAREKVQAFETLVRTITKHASRPLVRHEVGCSCVGSDECIYLNLIKTAAAGHLNDAALIATLLAGPAHAEAIALLAGQVGEGAKRVSYSHGVKKSTHVTNVTRLH